MAKKYVVTILPRHPGVMSVLYRCRPEWWPFLTMVVKNGSINAVDHVSFSVVVKTSRYSGWPSFSVKAIQQWWLLGKRHYDKSCSNKQRRKIDFGNCKLGFIKELHHQHFIYCMASKVESRYCTVGSKSCTLTNTCTHAAMVDYCMGSTFDLYALVCIAYYVQRSKVPSVHHCSGGSYKHAISASYLFLPCNIWSADHTIIIVS